jgi:ATP-binding cassette subfamily B protein
VFPIGFFAVFIIIKISGKYFISQQRDLGAVNGKVEETFTGLEVVKLFNLEDIQQKQFYSFNNKLVNSNYKSMYYGSMFDVIMNFTAVFGHAVVVLACALLAIFSSTTEESLS